MIDVHSHVLPAVDDGPSNLEEAVQLCERAAALGTTTLIATPHQNHPLFRSPEISELRQRVEDLQSKLGPRPRIVLGGEVRVDSSFLPALDELEQNARFCALGESRYLLLEFDDSGFGPDPVSIVHETRLAGWRPIVAHPELWQSHSETLFERLVERGGLLQITAASIAGHYGRLAQERCKDLLKHHLVHFVASDCHNVTSRPPGLQDARATVTQLTDERYAWRIFEANPFSVLNDRAVQAA